MNYEYILIVLFSYNIYLVITSQKYKMELYCLLDQRQTTATEQTRKFRVAKAVEAQTQTCSTAGR